LEREIIKRLEEVDWERIILMLTNYAQRKVDRIRWGYETDTLPKGQTPADIALEAIKDIFDGNRKWNPSRNPDLYTYLTSIVDSKISHLCEMKEHKVTRSMPITEKGKEVEEFLNKADPTSDHASYLTPVGHNPEAVLLKKEKMKRDEVTVSAFFEAIQGDRELEKLASLIMDGYIKPSEIAEQMNVEVREVYNLQKRFRRKCKDFKENSRKEEIL
jgi:DNA-directed RNA polymerase specialized sigma24 family protein